MRKLLLFLLITISAACQSAPAPISADKKVELYKMRGSLDAIVAKIQASPDWAEYQKLQVQAKADSEAVMKGVDPKKWMLDKDFNWIAIPAPPAPSPVQSTQEKK